MTFIIEILRTAGAALLIGVAGLVIYGVGLLLTRGRAEGGKRAVLLVLGSVAGVGSAFVWHFALSEAQGWTELMVVSSLMVCLGVGGIWLILSALRASNERVRKYFDQLLSGM